LNWTYAPLIHRCPRTAIAVFLAGLLFFAGAISAQVVNPADKQARPADTTPQPAPVEGTAQSKEGYRQHSYEMPPVVVEGKPLQGEIREEDRIGTYAQPRWTTQRRFPATRVYVVPEGKFEFEWWLRPEIPRHGGPVETQSQYEFEMGLPYRFQLDFYLVTTKEGNGGGFELDEQKVEGRWAVADWGVIPGNPTFYLEWAQRDSAADVIEGKLLLGGEIVSRWHWGTNLVFEYEMGDEHETAYELTAGLSYTIVDEVLSLGGEGKFALIDSSEDRGNFAEEVLIGPSLQLKPLPQMHIDVAPLFGVTGDSPVAQIYVVVGWEF